MDWNQVMRALRRQLQKRGIDRAELDDRTQDAAALMFVRMRRQPDMPVALAIWCAAGDAARGRTVHRHNPQGYVDAINPSDRRERCRIETARRESFDRRCALAQSDLDL